jgi:predicted phosphate transport protein (TIGR00153 family)
MRLNFLPKDATFYQLFEQQAVLIIQMCEHYRDLVVDYTDLPAKLAGLTDVEHAGDDLFRQISYRINATFVTPIDREDIHAIGSMMDDVLDLIQGSASRMILFEVGQPSRGLIELAEIMVECAGILLQGIRRLPKMSEIADLRKLIHTLESRGDQINREAVAALFRNCHDVNDVVSLIKWKEIIENVEDAIDKFEDVFDALENVIIKHA